MKSPSFVAPDGAIITRHRATGPNGLGPMVSTLSALGVLMLSSGSALGQHVHGKVAVGVVLEGQVVSVNLRSPLADVVGFEHEPRNDRQTERLQRAAALLSDGNAMFALPASAGCGTPEVSLDAPQFLQNLVGDPAGTHDDHDHDDHHDHEESHDHEEPNHHDHGDSHDHDHGDSHDHDDTHSEVDANYVWECEDASEIVAIEALFPKGFIGLDEVEFQILTPTGARFQKSEGAKDTIMIQLQ